MLAGFQLKCSCLVVVVVNTITWGDKLPLLIGFCHIHLSPMGGMFVHFALYIEGYAAVSLPALSNCVALYTCLRGKQWMKVIIHLGKMNTLRRLKVPKDTAAPSRNFKCIWMPAAILFSQLHLLSEKVWSKWLLIFHLWRSWRPNWVNNRKKKPKT